MLSPYCSRVTEKPSYRPPTEPVLVLYDSVFSDVTRVIETSLVSLYAIVTVRMILREEYGTPEPLLTL